ncbi:MAG: hypothetical protein ACLRK9_10125 [Roseburia hominis]
MYASKAAWEADLKEVDAIVSDLAKLEGSVMASAEKLLAALELGARAQSRRSIWRLIMRSACLTRIRRTPNIRQCRRKCTVL